MSKTIDLFINICDIEYLLGFVSFNLSKNEMSYHWYHPLESKQEHLNLNNDTVDGRVSHVTWHEYVINLNSNKKYNRILCQKQTDGFLPKRSIVEPLLVESFYLNGKSAHLIGSLIQKKSRTGYMQCIGKLDKLLNFSLCFFLLPKDYALEGLFIEQHDTRTLFHIDQICVSIGKIEIFEHFNLIVGLIPHAPILSDQLSDKICGAKRTLNFDEPMTSVNSILQIVHNANNTK